MNDVSRETRGRLDIFVNELSKWQRAINLVAPSTITDVWDRHVADCIQLVDHAPRETGSTWVDLGSGGGLPGLVVAAAYPSDTVHLIESDGRKCAFLRHASRLMQVNTRVWEGRVEEVALKVTPAPDIVTARALAPLATVLRYSKPWLSGGAIGLFMKGRQFDAELTVARESWRFDADLIPSRTDPDARIIRISRFEGAVPSPSGSHA